MTTVRWDRCPECAEPVRLDEVALECLRDHERCASLVCSSCAERLRLDEHERLIRLP